MSAQANQYDIRFSQAIKLLFFGVVNATSVGVEDNNEVAMCNRSNYTSRQPVLIGVLGPFFRQNGEDPVRTTTLFYENTVRLAAMDRTISPLSARGIPHLPSQTSLVSTFTRTRLISCASTHLDQQTTANSPTLVLTSQDPKTPSFPLILPA